MASPARTTRPAAEEVSTRERMLDVALEAFSELGYDGASTRAIASRAGVNQGMIPYYFGSKEALWREAVDRAFAELRAALDPALEAAAAGDDRERLARLIRSLVGFVARRPAFVRLMSEEGKREGKRMRWIVDRHVKPLFELTQDLGRDLHGALGGGPFAPLRFYIMVGAVTQVFHQAPECLRLTGLDPTDEATARAHADALVALFAPQPDPQAQENEA